MRTEAGTETNRASEVVPPVDACAPWRVGSLRVVGHGVLEVQFTDGTRGAADLRPFLAGERVVGTMFEPLRDPSRFAQAAVHLGAVEWPGGIDLAPDAMYEAIRASGTWVLD
ncbi:MAG: uncharacterized protein JWO56_680 [Acidobacteria bacterium]|nr:uncharacterized protein [Acidobacteriota bacterium]